MKILKGNFGKCIFVDNMDKDVGLPSLKEKSWDLCLTDPPYGQEFISKSNRYQKTNKTYEKGHEYKDKEFIGFDWFDLTLEKIQGMIITCGIGNLYKYILHKEPNYQIKGWYKPDSINFQNFDPILLYGKIKNIDKWGHPLLKFSITKDVKLIKLDHPCPKNSFLWKDIIKKMNPTSILDPFLGSGTTAQCCEEMGIPWLGYEIMEEYAPDIEKRIALGMKSHESYVKLKKKQSTLF